MMRYGKAKLSKAGYFSSSLVGVKELKNKKLKDHHGTIKNLSKSIAKIKKTKMLS